MTSNHVHLLLAEGSEGGVGEFMQRVGSSYVLWFNHKYERLGYLFHDRFRSEVIEAKGRVVGVMRYIHQNPLKAGMVSCCGQYVWSSYLAYLSSKEHQTGLTDTDKGLLLYGGIAQFVASHTELEDKRFVEAEYRTRVTPRQLAAAAKRVLQDTPVSAVKRMPLAERNTVLRELKSISGVTYAQIAYMIGVNKKMVERA